MSVLMRALAPGLDGQKLREIAKGCRRLGPKADDAGLMPEAGETVEPGKMGLRNMPPSDSLGKIVAPVRASMRQLA